MRHKARISILDPIVRAGQVLYYQKMDEAQQAPQVNPARVGFIVNRFLARRRKDPTYQPDSEELANIIYNAGKGGEMRANLRSFPERRREMTGLRRIRRDLALVPLVIWLRGLPAETLTRFESTLPPRPLLVFHRRLRCLVDGEDQEAPQAIAQRLHVSRARVWQIERHLLRQLKDFAATQRKGKG